uniref:Halohydrin dehalogenase n=1 Tax=Agrobacterium tumefaciens TaxID=358 RepID=UPI0001A66B7E|nr:Chain A, Halohydrin dehalogenase [Agrobacterium tumefaciens]4IXT_B Chain B, Halohydrin dehalogenase [Agrobacterium tumefaciens]4IXW_A Chain A, Halohydrin dehalogenase [Agrobacterium tumefaciens]4IXW_B Chain B, Halohydrin dehalogenase [Agrobacterium tumefaciens]4IY1_A Chain A, Halohydrin dehalogenase [Agrobacterium tumefaciens]4IY1_B Chain B, Halohydrin dehalogenase [Agrobacterium tumefaciens]
MSTAIVTNVKHFGGMGSALRLSEAGHTVACHDESFKHQDELEAFAETYPQLIPMSEQEPVELIEAVTSALGHVDILVSNDIAPVEWRPIDKYAVEDYRDMVEALQIKPFALANAVASQMKRRKSGHIIFITSAASFGPWKELSTYASARAGASALANALSKELGEHNIPVFAIAPNGVDSGDSPYYYPSEPWKTSPEHVAWVRKYTALQRLGTQKELGELVTFLASGSCDYLTGQVFWLAGGFPVVERWPGMPE